MRSIRDNKGFTLIELMIVVVIIGILAAIAIPRFTQVSASAKNAEAGPVLKQICSLAEAERLRLGDFPATQALLEDAGWEAPNAKYFDFSYAAGVATATPGGAEGAQNGVEEQSLDCETGAPAV